MKIFKDMDNNQFYMTVWSYAFLTTALLGTIIGYYNTSENTMIHDLVDKGHDPIELSCLFNVSNATEVQCALLIQSKVMTEK